MLKNFRKLIGGSTDRSSSSNGNNNVQGSPTSSSGFNTLSKRESKGNRLSVLFLKGDHLIRNLNKCNVTFIINSYIFTICMFFLFCIAVQQAAAVAAAAAAANAHTLSNSNSTANLENGSGSFESQNGHHQQQ